MRPLGREASRSGETKVSDLERSLIDGVISGDARAIDVWFRREHPRVYRIAFGFLADASEAEDLAQEAMVRLHDRLAEAKAARTYRAWSATLVCNLCRDRLRRESTRKAFEGAAPPLPERLPDPLRAAERKEVSEVLARALGGLAPREREAFVLVDLEGQSSAEAAEILGVGESSVRSLLALARRRLRELLGKRLQGYGFGGARS